VPPRSGEMVQPWAQPKRARVKRQPVTLVYGFDVAVLPRTPLALALERPQDFEIVLNGLPLNPAAESGWWVDKSLRTLPVDPAMLKTGRNELVLTIDYPENHLGLEIVYLLGDFGVTLPDGLNPVLGPLPATLTLGDWVPQGLPFYSGSLTYRWTVQPERPADGRVFVRVPAYRGVGLRVLVDGVPAGIVAWEPNEVDITDFLKADTVELGIQVLGHRRNSHGPLHHRDTTPYSVGPDTYLSGGEAWRDAYNLVPCGLLQAPELVVRKLV